MICIIVAVDENNAIGKNGMLPWHLREDMRRFKELTFNKSVIMGRKTYESIGQPLKYRWNIVLTNDKSFNADGVEVAHSITEALRLSGYVTFVIGGAKVYEQFLDMADMLFITRVHTEVEDADAFFPNIAAEQFQLLDMQEHSKDEHNDFDMTFEVWRRKE